jgi:hypothetical protein
MCRLDRGSPFVELGVTPFAVGQTTLKVASSKLAKHEKVCSDNQHINMFLYHLFFTLLVSYHQRLLTFYMVFKKSCITNVMSPRSMNVVYTRIGFVIQKGTQLVARLPSTQV